MKLTKILERTRETGEASIPAETKKVMASALEQLAASGIAEQAPREGSASPTFSLPNAEGKTVDIGAMVEQGPVVVSFYRGGWCPYCNLELRALQERLPEIEALGAKLVAVTPETPDNSMTTKQKNEVAFEVLSDTGNKVAREFGLVFRLPDALNDVYVNQFGVDVEAANGDQTHELPIPATFVIGKGDEIIKAYVEPDHGKRLDPDDIVESLRSAKAD